MTTSPLNRRWPKLRNRFCCARAQQETIQNALEKLPVKYREIILLCDLEEMSYQEIGETLGIPMGTVMSRLSRARKAYA